MVSFGMKAVLLAGLAFDGVAAKAGKLNDANFASIALSEDYNTIVMCVRRLSDAPPLSCARRAGYSCSARCAARCPPLRRVSAAQPPGLLALGPAVRQRPRDPVKLQPVRLFLLSHRSSTPRRFFAPWCGHCKDLKPNFLDLAKEYHGHEKAFIGTVDCTESRPTCVEQGIEGYPTVKYYIGGKADSPERFIEHIGVSYQIHTVAHARARLHVRYEGARSEREGGAAYYLSLYGRRWSRAST